MKFTFDNPGDILRSTTVLCSDCAIILASLYKKNAEPISTNLILPFRIIQSNFAQEEFYLIDVKHHTNSSEEEIKNCLNKILTGM